MTIINPLPYTIANGDPVDATPVEANFSQIVANVNANAAPVAGNASQQFLVATTTNPAGAVPLAQAQSQFAPISGSAVYAPATGNSSQTFAVASGTSSDAVPYTQLQSYVSANAAALSGSASQTFSVAPAASGSAEAPQQNQVLGAGAGAYTNVTSSRAINTTYTNTTSRPLWVSVIGQATLSVNAQLIAYLQVNGSSVSQFTMTNEGTTAEYFVLTCSAVVPPGATYYYMLQSASASGLGIFSWWEY